MAKTEKQEDYTKQILDGISKMSQEDFDKLLSRPGRPTESENYIIQVSEEELNLILNYRKSTENSVLN